MRRLAIFLCCIAAAAAFPRHAAADEAGEIKLLRQAIEQQSHQIDVLAQEIARLNQALGSKETASAAPAADVEAPSTEASTTPSGPVHIVTKGETLTSIAHHYKVTVAELLKVNKISDVRRLQIGQAVNLPPGAKIQPTPTPQP